VESARRVLREDPGAGIVLFGDGALRGALARQIDMAGGAGRGVLGGVCGPPAPPSPPRVVVVVGASSTGVSSAVVPEGVARGGGAPEVIEDGENGYLAPPGDAKALAGCVLAVLDAEDGGRGMGDCGRRRVREEFTFEAQAAQYRRLFAELTSPERQRGGGPSL